jgi:hypothetical protein
MRGRLTQALVGLQLRRPGASSGQLMQGLVGMKMRPSGSGPLMQRLTKMRVSHRMRRRRGLGNA